MTTQDEVRSALQPLIDQGLVHMVQASGGVPNPGQHESVTVMVNADNPEVHRVDIMKLVLQAGLKVELSLQPNPSRPQG
jgi:hypothetical protein